MSRYKVAEPAAKPGSVVDNHSSRPCLAAGLKQRTRGRVEPTHSPPIWPCSGWGLPCHAALAPHAVSSYLTVSPLPRTSCDAVRRFAFCCTGRRLAPPRDYLAPCSMEPGLSSARSSRDAVVLTDSAVTIMGSEAVISYDFRCISPTAQSPRTGQLQASLARSPIRAATDPTRPPGSSPSPSPARK